MRDELLWVSFEVGHTESDFSFGFFTVYECHADALYKLLSAPGSVNTILPVQTPISVPHRWICEPIHTLKDLAKFKSSTFT